MRFWTFIFKNLLRSFKIQHQKLDQIHPAFEQIKNDFSQIKNNHVFQIAIIINSIDIRVYFVFDFFLDFGRFEFFNIVDVFIDDVFFFALWESPIENKQFDDVKKVFEIFCLEIAFDDVDIDFERGSDIKVVVFHAFDHLVDFEDDVWRFDDFAEVDLVQIVFVFPSVAHPVNQVDVLVFRAAEQRKRVANHF